MAKELASIFASILSILSNAVTSSTMQSAFFTILVLVLCIFHLDAFLPSERSRTRAQIHRAKQRGLLPNGFSDWDAPVSSRQGSALGSTEKETDGEDATKIPLTHKDMVWKLRPPEGTSRRKKLWLRFAANVIRLDCFVFRKTVPTALCPAGGQALLEAHTRDANGKLVKVGRFGFSTVRGPPAEPIQETVGDLYGINTLVGVGAIVYMFVEPEYRKRNIGVMALEVIRCIHAIQGIDFTVLVVDDNGSGKLNDWYEQNGYARAPKLQNILGSPDAIHGVTMIAPTALSLDDDCRIKWW